MKTCVTCHEVKPLDAFNVRRSARDGRQPRCRDCCKAWYARNAAGHKVNTARRARKWRAETAKFLTDYFASHPCVDCGEADVRCLEFDHRPGVDKLDDVSKLIRHGYSLKRIEAEIEKCDVRCSNCHRRRTAERGGWWRQKVYERLLRAQHAGVRQRALAALESPWRMEVVSFH